MLANKIVNLNEVSRNEWLSLRKTGLGGSDAAVACGLSPWKSTVELWMEKTSQLEPKEPGEAAYWGTMLEPIIKTAFTEKTGIEVHPMDYLLQHPQYPFMLATVDGIVTDAIKGPGIFEAKTAGLYQRNKWEDEIPDNYAMQIQHYLAVTGLSYAYIAILIGGQDFRWKYIPRDEEVINSMIVLEQDFWNSVVNNIAPSIDGSKASEELLNRLYPVGQNTCMKLGEKALEHINEFERYQEEEKKAALRKDTAANKLKEMLGDNEKGIVSTRIVSWKNISSERLDSKGLKQDEPEIHSRYLAKSSYRRFSIR